MKKLVTLLLSLALVLSLAACGGEATPDASDDAPASSQNEESTENDNTENQIVFEEVVAIDNAECAVKITEIDPDNMWGYTLKAQLENKSTEKTYMFSVESASINGVQCDPMFASEVAAGKKANEEINFTGGLAMIFLRLRRVRMYVLLFLKRRYMQNSDRQSLYFRARNQAK